MKGEGNHHDPLLPRISKYSVLVIETGLIPETGRQRGGGSPVRPIILDRHKACPAPVDRSTAA